MVLALIGAAPAFVSYRRRARQEQTMRDDQQLPRSWLMLGMTVVMAAAALVFAILILTRS